MDFLAFSLGKIACGREVPAGRLEGAAWVRGPTGRDLLTLVGDDLIEHAHGVGPGPQ